jgi:hypothetical protein
MMMNRLNFPTILKRTLLTSFVCIVIGFSCKKDPIVYSPAAPEIVDTSFVLQNDIYPNPCQGIFTIKTNTTDSQNVSMYNTLGVQLFTLTITGTTAVVDNNLTNGVYFLFFSSKYGKSNRKLIVEK